MDEFNEMKWWEKAICLTLVPFVYLYAMWTLFRIKIGAMPRY